MEALARVLANLAAGVWEGEAEEEAEEEELQCKLELSLLPRDWPASSLPLMDSFLISRALKRLLGFEGTDLAVSVAADLELGAMGAPNVASMNPQWSLNRAARIS